MLTVGMPQALRIWVAYSPRAKEMLRSRTTSRSAPGIRVVQVEAGFAVVDALVVDTALFQRFEQPFFFHPYAGK